MIQRILPKILLGLCVLACVSPCFDSQAENAFEISVSAQVNVSRVTVAEPIRYELIVEYPQGMRVIFPDYQAEISGLSTKDYGITEPKKLSDNRFSQTQYYILESFVAGAYILEPQKVKIYSRKNELIEHASERIFIEVTSLIKPDDDDIRDIKPVISPRRFHGLVWFIVLLLVGVILWGLRYLFRKKQKTRVGASKPEWTPREKALQALHELKQQKLLELGNAKSFYFAVSSIIRYYLEGQFGFNAPEQTTEEFLHAISTSDSLTLNRRAALQDFLTECDLVKFANLHPQAPEAEKIFQVALQFIRETSYVENHVPSEGRT